MRPVGGRGPVDVGVAKLQVQRGAEFCIGLGYKRSVRGDLDWHVKVDQERHRTNLKVNQACVRHEVDRLVHSGVPVRLGNGAEHQGTVGVPERNEHSHISTRCTACQHRSRKSVFQAEAECWPRECRCGAAIPPAHPLRMARGPGGGCASGPATIYG